MANVRLSLTIDRSLRDYFKQMSLETGLPFEQLLARGLGAIKAFQDQKKIGRKHVGFVSDRTKLDAELILFS